MSGNMTRQYHHEVTLQKDRRPLPPNTAVAIERNAVFMQSIQALMNLEEDDSPTTDKPHIMPAVSKQVVAPVVISPPPFIEYRSVDNPLTMLFGAIVAYVQRFDH